MFDSHINPPLQWGRYDYSLVQVSSVAQSCWTLRPHEPQHARPSCPSPTPGVYPNPCPSSRWCHLTISSSVIPFSSCPQSFLASQSFQMSQLFASDGQNIGVSASTSLLPMNTQDWSPLEWTGWISLQSKGLSRVFSNTIVQKHPFFGGLYKLKLKGKIFCIISSWIISRITGAKWCPWHQSVQGWHLAHFPFVQTKLVSLLTHCSK